MSQAQHHRHDSGQIDRTLVREGIQGSSESWEKLYLQCQPSICAAIRDFLFSVDEEQVDEIAAVVWFRLVRDDFRLLRRFTADRRVRLATYLSAIARNVAREQLRRSARRRQHECNGGKEVDIQQRKSPEPISTELDDFIASVSDRESRYVRWATTPHGRQRYFTGRANHDYQLRHRVRQKLTRYLSGQRMKSSLASE